MVEAAVAAAAVGAAVAVGAVAVAVVKPLLNLIESHFLAQPNTCRLAWNLEVCNHTIILGAGHVIGRPVGCPVSTQEYLLLQFVQLSKPTSIRFWRISFHIK